MKLQKSLDSKKTPSDFFVHRILTDNKPLTEIFLSRPALQDLSQPSKALQYTLVNRLSPERIRHNQKASDKRCNRKPICIRNTHGNPLRTNDSSI